MHRQVNAIARVASIVQRVYFRVNAETRLNIGAYLHILVVKFNCAKYYFNYQEHFLSNP